MPDLFIGLMSGTSVDAVDGALVDLSGPAPLTLGFESEPIPMALRAALREQLLAGDD